VPCYFSSRVSDVFLLRILSEFVHPRSTRPRTPPRVNHYGLGSHPRSFVFLAWNAVNASYHRPPCSLAPNLLLPTPAERPSNRCKPDRHIISSRPTRSRGRTRGVKQIGIQRSPGGLDKSRKLLHYIPPKAWYVPSASTQGRSPSSTCRVASDCRRASCRGGGALRGRLSLRSRDGGVDCRGEEARREGLNLR
jgi:hypothetical protein